MESSSPTYLRGRSAGHVIMFWILATLAAMVFIPCVLTPIWVETEQMYAVEQRVATSVARLEEVAERNKQREVALLTDPLVNERLARQELKFQSESESVLHWSPEELAAMAPADTSSPSKQNVSMVRPPLTPTWIQRASSWLPDWPWRRLFAESPQRPLLLLMAGGLLLAAFLLYAPTPLPAEDP